MSLLLEHGAEFSETDLNGKTPFDCALDIYSKDTKERKSCETLIMHRALRESQNFSESWVENFHARCLLELSAMKNDLLCDGVTVKAILDMNLDSLAMLLKNKSIAKAMNAKKDNLRIKYPIYEGMFEQHFSLALERLQDSKISDTKCILQTVNKC